jgi:hypothetical protein
VGFWGHASVTCLLRCVALLLASAAGSLNSPADFRLQYPPSPPSGRSPHRPLIFLPTLGG